MAYTPNNPQIFNAAYAGSFAGISVNGAAINDSVVGDYASAGVVAGAFAQAIDTAWGAKSATLLDVDTIMEACQSFWSTKALTPGSQITFSLPATWLLSANAILALVSAAEAYFAGQGIIPIPIPGSSNTNPYLAQTAWFVDYVAGNNANDGKTAATAVKSAAQIKNRWQGGVAGTRPQLPGITITITCLSNAPDFTDPWSVLLDVDMAGGGKLVFVGTPLTAIKTSTLTSASVFARTSAGGQITITDATVPNWGALGVPALFIDTTATGVAWLYEPKTGSSANGIISPARSPATAGTSTDAAVTVTTADAYQLVPLVSIYFGTGATFRTAPNIGSASAPTATFQRLHMVAPGGVGGFEGMEVYSDNTSGIFWQECLIDQEPLLYGFQNVQNCWGQGGAIVTGEFGLSNPNLVSGGGYWFMIPGTGVSIINNDYTLDGNNPVSMIRGLSGSVRAGRAGFWGTNSTQGVFAMSEGNFVRVAGLNGAGDVLYGKVGGTNPIFTLNGSSYIQSRANDNTFSSAWQFDTNTFTMNANGSGFGFNLATGAFVGPTTFTTPHIDAALAAGTGFGGNAADPTVGTYATTHNG